MRMIGVTTARVQDYLGALERAVRDLPRDRRHEMMRDISGHIEAALAEDSSPAAVERVLASLGSPDEIAAAAYAELPPRRQNMPTRDVVTVILLLVGGLVLPVVGWIIGLVLLWTSNTWGVREKIIGTVLVPGGLLFPLLMGGLAFVATGGGSTQQCVSVAPAPVGGVLQQTTQQCTGGGGGLTTANILAIALLVISILGPIFSAIWLVVTARRSTAYRAAYQAA
jgi:hypothetical protein